MKRKIAVINRLLLKEFGLPPRNASLPDPVDTLVATILSQNTNDKNSYKAFLHLKATYPRWQDVARLTPGKLQREIRVAGLAAQKAKAILNALCALEKKNGISLNYLNAMSEEQAITELTSFSGVGVKTASCVLLFSLQRNVCPVDTHVHRVANRLGLVTAATPDKTFALLNASLPDGTAHSFHTNMIRLGREFCKPAKPACSACPLVRHCLFPEKNMQSAATKGSGSFMLLDSLA